MRPGASVLHYRVVRALGDGGMGTVFEAEDLRLGRVVALKFPLRQGAEPELRARMAREARAAAALQHPNVATVHALEELDGHPFLVMERLGEASLAARLAAGPLPLEELCDVGRQAALGLAAAHRAGVVHKDVKPSNLLFGPDGSVKVIDFGLAALLEPADRTLTAVTADASGPSGAPGPFAGSVPYMSPEQVRGEPLDAATDVFSLAVTLHEAATGHRPFDRATAVLTAHAIAYEAHAPLTGARPGFPPALAALLERALAKEPSARPAMDELAVALAAGARGEARERGGGRARALGGAFVVGVLGVGVAAALGVRAWGAPPAPASTRVEGADRERAAPEVAPSASAPQAPQPTQGAAAEPPPSAAPAAADPPAVSAARAAAPRPRAPAPTRAPSGGDPWLLGVLRACLVKTPPGPVAVRLALSDGTARSIRVTGDISEGERACVVARSWEHVYPRDAITLSASL